MGNHFMVLLFLTIICVICTVSIVNAQDSSFGQEQNLGPTFEEVIVSSDLNVRRKSKENREGKKLLTNIPSSTSESKTDGNPTLSRLISTSDGTNVYEEKRYRRNANQKYRVNLEIAGWLLNSDEN